MFGWKDGNLEDLRFCAISVTAYEGADTLVARFARCSALRWVDAGDVVAEIMRRIEEKWHEKQYAKIAFVGHSAGAVLLRKVYLAAMGRLDATKPDKFED